MQLASHPVPTVALAETEEMGETPVLAVVVHLVEEYDSVLPEMIHIS